MSVNQKKHPASNHPVDTFKIKSNPNTKTEEDHLGSNTETSSDSKKNKFKNEKFQDSKLN